MNREPPTVSWVLCTHVLDTKCFAAIRSCLDQSFGDFELLIIANGTNCYSIAADLREKFGRDPRLAVYSTQLNGLTFSLNLGVHLAQGEFLARMDSDDESSPDRLELQVAFMRANPRTSVLGTSFQYIDSQGQLGPVVTPPLTNAEIRKALRFRNPIAHPTVMIRRSLLLAEGGYLGDLHAQDYDAWCRIARRRDVEFANLPNVCLRYRSTGVGTARGSAGSYSSDAAAQFKNFALTKDPSWFVGFLFTCAKLVFRARRQ